MIDLKFIKRNKKLVEESIFDRGMSKPDFKCLFSLDKKRKELLLKLDYLNKRKNTATQFVEKSVLSNKKVSLEIFKKIKNFNNDIKQLEKDIARYKQEIKKYLVNFPNIPHSSVPAGVPGKPNKTIRKYRKNTKFNFSPKTYLEIGKKLGIIDFSDSFYKFGFDVIFYKGLGAQLQRALINFLMDKHVANGYHELSPPVIADGQPILKMLQGRVFEAKDLPKGYSIYSLCFRKDWTFADDIEESMKRIRQFDSVSLIKLVKPNISNDNLEDIVKEAEKILKLLEIPFEVAIFTRGNLDYASSKAYSIKSFFPGLNTSLEISNCTNLGSYFSKDMNICYKDGKSGEKGYAHILNATNLIIPRAMIAILENFQQSDGSICVPGVLRPYLNGLDKIS